MHARVPAVGVVIAAALLAAAAGVLGAVSGSPAGRRPGSAAAFVSEVLVHDAIVPPGGHPTTVDRALVPSWISEPGVTAGRGGMSDLHRLYLYEESPEAVEAAIRSRIPSSARISSTGTFTGLARFLEETVPVSGRHEYSAHIEYTIAPVDTSQSASELRVDAVTQWLPSRPRTEQVPSTGVAQVTGYRTISLAGSLDPHPVTVAVPRAKVGRLVQILNSLPRGPTAVCAESTLLFEVSISSPRRGRPAERYLAKGWGCEQSVSVSERGSTLPELSDSSCALLREVASLLPSRRARATRAAASACAIKR